ILRGLQEHAVRSAMSHAARGGDPRAVAAAQALDYLGRPPIQTGEESLDRAVVQRSNRPEAARALLATAAVTSAATALGARARLWDWALHPDPAKGTAEMTFSCRGRLDAEALGLVRTLLSEALDHLTGAGLIARRAVEQAS